MRFPGPIPSLILLALTLQGLAAQDGVPLPVRKVVLYKNGMGYFQHLGPVSGSAGVEITLPSSQLNDVLKSLTVLDLGGGRVGGVTYDSVAPLERRLGELPFDTDSAYGLAEFLNRLRGTVVRVRAPEGTITGKLLGAELRTRSGDLGTSSQVTRVSIFSDSGEVRLVDLESAGGIGLTDSALAGDVGRYLDLLNSSNRRDVRRLQIQTSGSGGRQLFVAYTSEAPIWKTTYRIVLDPDQKPLLQGWAIVDNTTPMDWSEIELSLVAGAPVSFVQQLSQPVYGRRPEVPLPGGVQVTPRIHEGTLLEKAGGELQDVRSEVARARPGAAPMEVFAGRAEMAAQPPPLAPPELSEAIRDAITETAQGRALAEQFEYRLPRPVTIRKNQSALLPIVHSDVEAEKVSLFNESHGERRPRLAVWLRNSTGLALDGGAFTLIDSNAFAGEGLLDTLQPGERRLLSYAVDLAMEVSTARSSAPRQVERVVINRGLLRLQRKTVETRNYTLRNRAEKARTLILEHPVRGDWNLMEPSEPEETSARFYRFRIEAEPNSSREFQVREERPAEEVYHLVNITSDQIGLWVRQKVLSGEIEQALQRVVARKAEIAGLDNQIKTLEQEREGIFRDQSRVRDNLGRLGRSPDESRLRQRYIAELENQEDRLAQLGSELQNLQTARRKAQDELDSLIQNLSFDRKI